MSFPLAVALALALAFPRTGLAQDDPCLDSGCQSASPRFFYNSTRSRCERLVGGCGSNRNTFKTLESCQDLCHIKFVCYRPVQYGGYPPIRFSTGIRDTTVNFYFYNVSSGRCEGFHFRGWGSNGNIFRTVKECESLCGDVKDRCLDFMKYSSCQSESPRFFYNRTSSRCEQLFGDCRSNNKTFGTLESCEALCYGNGRPVSEDPGKNKILSGIIVLMVVFLVIVAIVVLLVQYCRHASSNGFRLVVSDP